MPAYAMARKRLGAACRPMSWWSRTPAIYSSIAMGGPGQSGNHDWALNAARLDVRPRPRVGLDGTVPRARLLGWRFLYTDEALARFLKLKRKRQKGAEPSVGVTDEPQRSARAALVSGLQLAIRQGEEVAVEESRHAAPPRGDPALEVRQPIRISCRWEMATQRGCSRSSWARRRATRS